MRTNRRVALAPDRMTEAQLWEHCKVLITRCRFGQNHGPWDRERQLDQLEICLLELRMRGHQLTLD